jgi:rod shape-determining protein MreC
LRRAALAGTRVDAALLAVCILFAFVLKASPDTVREGLAALLRRTILAPMFSLQAGAERFRSALGTFDAILAQRDSALMQALDLPALQAENRRLEELMMLGGRLNWGFVPARVLHSSTPGIPKTVTIDVGSRAGVRPRSPVVGVAGLVGIVDSVDVSTSVVSLWTHQHFAAGAMTEDGKAFGIVKPHLSSGSDGYLLEMQYVNYGQPLRAGTRIVASGQGGVYPAMVPIGTIVDSLETADGWARAYLVRPAVLPQDLTAVLVLRQERAGESVASAWPTPAQVDSAARAIAVRGDSLARVRLLAEQKAQADSALARLRAGARVADTVIPPP